MVSAARRGGRTAGEAAVLEYYRLVSVVAARGGAGLGDRADVRQRGECEEWFGPLDPAVAGRFGDVVVAALGDFAVFSSREFAREMEMAGFHGSTSETETRIPLLIG